MSHPPVLSRRASTALATLVLLSVAPQPALADDLPTDAGVWSNQLFQLDFKKPGEKHGWQLSFDFHERAWGSSYLMIIRPAVGYDIGHGITFWLGYAFVPSNTWGAGTPWKLEHRIWEQFLATEKVGNVALQGRVRQEERFLQSGGDVGGRLRLYGRAGFFFSKESHWGWAVSDEVLIRENATDSFGTAGFDQNRAFTGPFFQAADGVRIEFGYMNFVNNKKDVGLVDSHIAMMNLFVPIKVFKADKADKHVASAPGVGTDLADGGEG